MSKEFWEAKYDKGQDGWDLGQTAPALRLYIDQLKDKSLKILIPGAGYAHEAEYLHAQGFDNVYVVEIAEQAIAAIKKRIPNFPEDRLIEADFFDLTDTDFDIVLEQTFFCAIKPEQRQDYADKMAALLKPGGKIAGIMFDFPLTHAGPPYGGGADEYKKYFKKDFTRQIMERNNFSVMKRAGRELFVKIKRN